MRTKAKRFLVSLTAAAMAMIMTVTAVLRANAAGNETEPLAVLSGMYHDTTDESDSIISRVEDPSKLKKARYNITADGAGNVVGMTGGSCFSMNNSVFSYSNDVTSGSPQDLEIEFIEYTENSSDIPWVNSGIFFVGTGIVSFTVNSIKYLDADENILAEGNVGKRIVCEYKCTQADIKDWTLEKAAAVKKAVVCLEAQYESDTTGRHGSICLNGDEMTYGGSLNVPYNEESDYVLSYRIPREIEIPADLSGGEMSLSINDTYYGGCTNETYVKYIKFLDKNDNVVFQLPSDLASTVSGNVTVEEPVIGIGAPETKIENLESVKEAVGFTPEEKTAIENGADVKVTLSVEKADDKITPEEKEEIKNKAPENFAVGAYLDIKMDKQVGNLVKRAVTELLSKIEITVAVPADIINTDENTTREYVIIHMHNGTTEIINGRFDPVNNTFTFPADKFSTYAIAYKDTPKEKEPEPVIPVYSVTVNGNASVNGAAAEGSEMTVTMPIGFTARVYNGSTLVATIRDSGKFTMPAGNVVVNVTDESGAGMMAYVAPNTYIYSYDSSMKLIKTSRSKKGIAGMGEMTVDLGAAYAGRTVTLYSGKKSTSEKITETVLDSKGRATFTVKGAKNYTLVVED